MQTSKRAKTTVVLSVFISSLFPIAVSSSKAQTFEDSKSKDQRFDECLNNLVIEREENYRDYQVRITRSEDFFCRLIEIKKGEEIVFHEEDIGSSYYLGSDMEEDHSPFLYLTDKIEPYLVYAKWTGGAHCCYSLHIFKLYDEFKKIDAIEGDHFLPYFEDLNGDGVQEIRALDYFLAYQFSSFVMSATAEVILKFSGDKYTVAAEYMIKPTPHLGSYKNLIESWQSEFQHSNEYDWPPPGFVQAFTNLIFTGNKQAGLELIDMAWPADIAGKGMFLKSYEEALSESNFYPKFEEQL